MTKLFNKLLRETSGATAVEYGLILAMIALTSLVALQGVANETSSMWAFVRDRSDAAVEQALPR